MEQLVNVHVCKCVSWYYKTQQCLTCSNWNLDVARKPTMY
jgi:hypothetical protein